MGNIFEAIWDDIRYGNPEVEFREWLNKNYQLCHPEHGGTLYQKKQSHTWTRKYTLEELREMYNKDQEVKECDATGGDSSSAA